MFPPKKILFPVDFSDRCTDASRMVETLAGHFQAQLTLLHVLQPFTYNVPVDPRATAAEQLNSYLYKELSQLDVARVVLDGEPAAMITEFARSQAFDLIAMPTHGYGGFRRLVLGSVTSSVLRHALCPVWTGVHMENVPRLEDIAFRKIVCAIDLGSQSRAALCWAGQLAWEFGAKLEVVHVIPDVKEHLVLEEDLIAEAEKRVLALLQSLGSDARPEILAGDVAEGVCDYASREKADLLILGRSAHDDVLGRLKANAYSIIRQAPCSVISI